MIIILKNTDRIVDVNGIKSRLWEGKAEDGTPISVLIIRIAVEASEKNQEQFEKELEICSPPSSVAAAAFPIRLVI